MSKNVIDVLEERGLIANTTSPDLKEVTTKPIRVYAGFDPTSDSLHLGNLQGIIALAWFQRCGHTPVALVGGATGLVGDPSGKSHERPLLTPALVEENLKGIAADLSRVLKFGKGEALLLNNYDWFQGISFIEFLRDTGKHFRMGPMLGKDMVRTRLESDEGLSYTEFSYQLLQAYDFLHLFDTEQVVMQIGGSDQWGNITSGLDLVRKVRGESVHGLTFPLLTRSDGKKFGKSEEGAVWLSPEKLSPYEFYQHLVRTTDEDVITLMSRLTFMAMEEIHEWERRMQGSGYQPNSAQKALAEAVTRIVHHDEGVKTALTVTEKMKPGAATELSVEALAGSDIPSVELPRSDVVGSSLVDLLVAVGMCSGKGEGRRLIKNGGVYLNNNKVADEGLSVSEGELVEGRLLLLGVGKKRKMVVRLGP